MTTGAQVRRDENPVPSLDFDEQTLLEILQDDPDRELDAEVLHEIVHPMLDIMRQLIRENPQQAKKGLRISINIKSQDSPDTEYLTTAEVAKLYRMSQQQIRRWCESGKIIALRAPGGSWRIQASQFEGVAGYVVPKGRKQKRDVNSIAGAWKDNKEALRELREERD